MGSKDLYCSYYTNSEDITSYMVEMLEITDHDIILEPSAGEGTFVDVMLQRNKPVHIDALDIDHNAIAIMKSKYQNNTHITVRETDTLLDDQLDQYATPELWLKQTDTLLDTNLDYFSLVGGYYTKIVGNPPYGAWQDYEKRELLKEKFPGHYVKETYSLFLLRCLSLLRMGGKLSFIISDTFLFLNMHSRLREVLLRKSKISQILLFPSKFFPGISFGYSNLSIITLERCDDESALKNTAKIITNFKSPREFSRLIGTHTDYPTHLKVFEMTQESVLMNPQYRFILADEKISEVFDSTSQTLGDVAEVVTGFYTGDNKRFIRALSEDVKGSKNHGVINPSLTFECTSINGIPSVGEGYIPYIKSASKHRYLRGKDEWFVRWDQETIKYYNSNKKSRFQNSSFYFQTGIGLPMVKSKTIRAFLMQERVFDQSIVGIFPKDSAKLLYILALMNSDSINELIHTINPTANNSANYIKQLPYIEPDTEIMQGIIEKTSALLKAAESNDFDLVDEIHNELNSIINEVYSGPSMLRDSLSATG